ncbi:hypothetical protein QFC22_003065 [Naganishia vaughanmartiniae]|uniref:Uncharacterized protein n=1 Tax=Naganishia vaughanmartiniae TaxID=1424756 RepID=A0ACC2X9S8_9TREE|nr:hypothetical protein QFC22_003065 [Naganishia vaughanmartiniae]
MASSRRTDSDLTSVSSGLSSMSDEQPITNGKGSKASKSKASKPVKETKSATKPKVKPSTEGTKGKKATVVTETAVSKDSGKSTKDMNKAKTNGKGKEKMVPEVEKVEKIQRTYGMASQDMIDYEEDEDIKADWQVPYVWAFIVKFCKEAIKGLCIVDELGGNLANLSSTRNHLAPARRVSADRLQGRARALLQHGFELTFVTFNSLEAGLQSMGPHDGIAEVLAALLKGVQGQNPDARPKHEPSPDQLAISVKKLLESRLKSGCPLTVFDSYVYGVKSYVPKDQGEGSVSARKELDQYRNLERTDVQEDRRRRNPLLEKGFWAVEWQVRLKILRQLVDWTHSLYSAKKQRPASTVYSCDIEGVKDGSKRHIYRIDPSYRVYAANKMYHMGAPLHVLTSNRAEYENLVAEYKASQRTLEQLQKSGKKNSVAKRNAENNIKVGELLEEDLPKIEEAEAEIARAKERYQKSQARKLRALAQLEASSFALTTRSRTRKVVNYNETQAEDDFDEQLPPEDHNVKRPSRSSTSSSFQEADSRGAKRDFEETESVQSDSVPPLSSRSDIRVAKRARGNESDSRGDPETEDASPEL